MLPRMFVVHFLLLFHSDMVSRLPFAILSCHFVVLHIRFRVKLFLLSFGAIYLHFQFVHYAKKT